MLKWDVSGGYLGQCLQRLPLLTPAAAQQAAAAQRSPALLGAGPDPAAARLPPAIRALDAMQGSGGVFIAGEAHVYSHSCMTLLRSSMSTFVKMNEWSAWTALQTCSECQ